MNILSLITALQAPDDDMTTRRIVCGCVLLVFLVIGIWLYLSAKSESRKAERERKVRKRANAMRRAKMTPEQRAEEDAMMMDVGEQALKHLGIGSRVSEVVTVGSVVVAYRPGLLTDKEMVKIKLREILEGDPNAPLDKIAGALGIVLVNVSGQRAKTPTLTGDVEIGEFE